MKLRLTLMIFVMICVTTVPNAVTGTIYSSKGLGSPYFYPHSRSLGMGGLYVATSSPMIISRLNPAGLFRLQNTRLSVQYFFEGNRYSEPDADALSQYSNLDGFTFAMPLGKGFHVSASLQPVTRMDFHLSFEEELESYPYTKSVQGSGGLNVFSLSFAYAPIRTLSFGISGRYYFGKLEEKWSIRYNGVNFIPSGEIFSTQNSGVGMTAGFVFWPIRQVSFGALISPQVRLKSKTEIVHAYSSTPEIRDGDIDFPMSWGVGLNYHFGQIGLVGVQYTERDWTKMTYENDPLIGLCNSKCLSVGSELQISRNPMDPILKRLAFRLGASYQPYFSKDPTGQNIQEVMLTMGLGWPMFMNVAQIDMAVQFGKRGSLEDNDFSEKLIRVSVSLTGGEKWFVRRY